MEICFWNNRIPLFSPSLTLLSRQKIWILEYLLVSSSFLSIFHYPILNYLFKPPYLLPLELSDPPLLMNTLPQIWLNRLLIYTLSSYFSTTPSSVRAFGGIIVKWVGQWISWQHYGHFSVSWVVLSWLIRLSSVQMSVIKIMCHIRRSNVSGSQRHDVIIDAIVQENYWLTSSISCELFFVKMRN